MRVKNQQPVPVNIPLINSTETLEGMLCTPDNAQGMVLLLSPFNCGYNEKTIQKLSEALTDLGYASLRLDYKKGSFNLGGIKYAMESAHSAIDFLQNHLSVQPDPKSPATTLPLYLAGYSFGGGVAIKLAHTLENKGKVVSGLLTIAPAYHDRNRPKQTPWCWICGSKDKYAGREASIGYAAVQCEKIEGATHYFSDPEMEQICEALKDAFGGDKFGFSQTTPPKSNPTSEASTSTQSQGFFQRPLTARTKCLLTATRVTGISAVVASGLAITIAALASSATASAATGVGLPLAVALLVVLGVLAAVLGITAAATHASSAGQTANSSL